MLRLLRKPPFAILAATSLMAVVWATFQGVRIARLAAAIAWVERDAFIGPSSQSTLTSADLTEVLSLENLRELNLEGATLPDNAAGMIAEKQGLKFLGLARNGPSSLDLEPLSSMENLVGLDLSGIPMKKEMLARICTMPGIPTLDITNTNLRDADFQRLNALPQLESLSIGGPTITDLSSAP